MILDKGQRALACVGFCCLATALGGGARAELRSTQAALSPARSEKSGGSIW